MENKITVRQKQLLKIIYNFVKDTGYSPSFEDMRGNLGVASNQSIIDLLNKLKKGNFIKKDDGARSIAIKPLGYEVLGRPALAPVLGITTAGVPVEAMEITGEWQELPSSTGYDKIAYLESEVYMIRVMGDSMINAGIDDGDLLLVKKTCEFRTRDIVVARNDDGTTVKRFIAEPDGRAYLKPENPAYKIIPIYENTIFEGKVISIFKSGNWKPVK